MKLTLISLLLVTPLLVNGPALAQSERASEPIQIDVPASLPPDIATETLALPSERPLTILAMGSLIGLAVPFKYGVALSYRYSPRWQIEAGYFAGRYEFSSGFLDVGGFRENVVSLDARYFAFHSFNFIFGLSRQTYIAHIGNDILAAASQTPNGVDLLNVQTLGLQLGLGNRWTIGRWAIGVDWLVLNFPFYTLGTDAPVLNYLPDSDARGRIDGVLKVMRYLPTGAIGKLAVGCSF